MASTIRAPLPPTDRLQAEDRLTAWKKCHWAGLSSGGRCEAARTPAEERPTSAVRGRSRAERNAADRTLVCGGLLQSVNPGDAEGKRVFDEGPWASHVTDASLDPLDEALLLDPDRVFRHVHRIPRSGNSLHPGTCGETGPFIRRVSQRSLSPKKSLKPSKRLGFCRVLQNKTLGNHDAGILRLLVFRVPSFAKGFGPYSQPKQKICQ